MGIEGCENVLMAIIDTMRVLHAGMIDDSKRKLLRCWNRVGEWV